MQILREGPVCSLLFHKEGKNLITVIADESRKFGLEINNRKTFCMTISKKSVSPKCNLDIDGIKIKQVENFEYLGSLVTSDANQIKK